MVEPSTEIHDRLRLPSGPLDWRSHIEPGRLLTRDTTIRSREVAPVHDARAAVVLAKQSVRPCALQH